MLFCLRALFQRSDIPSHRDRQSHCTEFSEHSAWMATYFPSLLFCLRPRRQQSDNPSQRVCFSHKAHIPQILFRCILQLPRLRVRLPVPAITAERQLLCQSEVFASKQPSIPRSRLPQHAPHRTALTTLYARRRAMACAGSSAVQSTTATASTATTAMT